MKKFVITLITLFLLFIIYYDIKTGTLTTFSKQSITYKQSQDVQNHLPKQKDAPFKMIKVTPGATVLSISEQLHNGRVPVSIQQLVTDFKKLNPNTQPQKIQIGKTYKFPIYKFDMNQTAR